MRGAIRGNIAVRARKGPITHLDPATVRNAHTPPQAQAAGQPTKSITLTNQEEMGRRKPTDLSTRSTGTRGNTNGTKIRVPNIYSNHARTACFRAEVHSEPR